MFNGIIFNKGTLKKIIKRKKGINIFIKSDLKLSKKDIGVSISCDGVCLMLISIKKNIMEFYLSKETIERSKFRYLKKNEEIKFVLETVKHFRTEWEEVERKNLEADVKWKVDAKEYDSLYIEHFRAQDEAEIEK